jgi:hypothetical protein
VYLFGGIALSNNNEQMPTTGKWVNLSYIIFCGRSQTQSKLFHLYGVTRTHIGRNTLLGMVRHSCKKQLKVKIEVISEEGEGNGIMRGTKGNHWSYCVKKFSHKFWLREGMIHS